MNNKFEIIDLMLTNKEYIISKFDNKGIKDVLYGILSEPVLNSLANNDKLYDVFLLSNTIFNYICKCTDNGTNEDIINNLELFISNIPEDFNININKDLINKSLNMKRDSKDINDFFCKYTDYIFDLYNIYDNIEKINSLANIITVATFGKTKELCSKPKFVNKIFDKHIYKRIKKYIDFVTDKEFKEKIYEFVNIAV